MTAPALANHPGQGERMLLTGNHAASYGAMLAGNAGGGIVIAAYPITPQTDIIKRLSDMVADGSLENSRYIPVESEHSAMAVMLSASNTGARCPTVLANVNRALAPAWSIFTDQQDSLSMRDTGWLQYYCADNQEVLDSILLGFRIGEELELPVMPVLDAFVLSHTSDQVYVPSVDTVREFLPPYEREISLDPEHPTTFAGLAIPALYSSFRRKIDRDLARVPEVEAAAEADFEKIFGRRYRAVTGYRVEDADIIIVASATSARTAKLAVDKARTAGVKVGVVRVRRFRPFPSEIIRDILANASKVAVFDRNISLGSEGIFATEIKAALYGSGVAPQIYGYILGLGGQDITPDTVTDIIERTQAAEAPPAEPTWIGILPDKEVEA